MFQAYLPLARIGLFWLIVFSLCVTVLSPSGIPFRLFVPHVPESTGIPPADDFTAVVSLQMKQLMSPDDQLVRVLGAVTETAEDGSLSCRPITLPSQLAVTCKELLTWERLP